MNSRRWPQGLQFQLKLLQPVQTSSSLGFVFADDNIIGGASITTVFTIVKVSAFVKSVLAFEVFPSFIEQLMLMLVIVIIVVMIGAFNSRHVVITER